jgi:DNA-binding transcriptional ArsR family regulator
MVPGLPFAAVLAMASSIGLGLPAEQPLAKPKNKAQLTANTEISRQGVTKHLQVLADAGVVRGVKLGRERLWQLEPGQIEEAKRTLEVIGRQWEVALGKLKAFAESP